MDVAEIVENAEWQMHQLRNYAIQYSNLRRQDRKTHMKAKMIRRRMETIKAWFDAIELQLKEDEE